MKVFLILMFIIILMLLGILYLCSHLHLVENKFKKDTLKDTINFINTSFLNVLHKYDNDEMPNNVLSVVYLNGNKKLDELLSIKADNNIQSVNYSIGKTIDRIIKNPRAYYDFKRQVENLRERIKIKDDESLVKYLCNNPIDLTRILIGIYTDISFVNKSYNNEFYVWLENNCLYFRSKGIWDIGKNKILINEIISFSRDGDVFNETHISGGGGGGSSLTGAIVGGVVAGGVGAVIGSREKVNEIKTDNIIVDKRTTILEYKEDNKVKYMFFDSDSYEVFLKLIPSKQFNFVHRNKNIENNTDESNSRDVMSQIKELSELKEQGVLTEEEFSEKKKILLDKIK